VANSGGPDSACLLYLLNSVFHHSEPEPRQVISINVDHGLQDSSSYMSQVAGQIAKRFNTQHVTACVPWSTGAFPSIPKHGVETLARSARYKVLLDQMQQRDIHILAVGHHAYDQQETVLMRLETEMSEERAPVGMSYIRRWGMGRGQKSDLQYYGMHGMDRWIIRPLLGFGKVNIMFFVLKIS
jgi:tRNA(Ile)-lysidine synthase